MRAQLIGIALACLATACTGWVRPSELRPAAHPLLEGLGTGTVAPLDRVSRAPAPARGHRAQRAHLGRRLKALKGRRTLGGLPARDLSLVRSAFGPLDLSAAPEAASGPAGLIRRSRVRRGKARVGDLLFFHAAPQVPRVCIVERRRRSVLQAVCVTRGAVRRVFVDPLHPDARRRGGRVVNSFLRPIRKGDEARAAYTAGRLLREIRTVMD